MEGTERYVSDGTPEQIVLRKLRPRFRDRITPSHLIPFLTCLNRIDEEQIQAGETNKGPITATLMFLNVIIKKSDWYEDLLQALKNDDVKLGDLATMLEKEIREYKQEIRQHQQKHSMMYKAHVGYALNESISGQYIHSLKESSLSKLLSAKGLLDDVDCSANDNLKITYTGTAESGIDESLPPPYTPGKYHESGPYLEEELKDTDTSLKSGMGPPGDSRVVIQRENGDVDDSGVDTISGPEIDKEHENTTCKGNYPKDVTPNETVNSSIIPPAVPRQCVHSHEHREIRDNDIVEWSKGTVGHTDYRSGPPDWGLNISIDIHGRQQSDNPNMQRNKTQPGQVISQQGQRDYQHHHMSQWCSGVPLQRSISAPSDLDFRLQLQHNGIVGNHWHSLVSSQEIPSNCHQTVLPHSHNEYKLQHNHQTSNQPTSMYSPRHMTQCHENHTTLIPEDWYQCVEPKLTTNALHNNTGNNFERKWANVETQNPTQDDCLCTYSNDRHIHGDQAYDGDWDEDFSLVTDTKPMDPVFRYYPPKS
ncbi:uncharacterized protein LOC144445049 [Glandiceps talaboti]